MSRSQEEVKKIMAQVVEDARLSVARTERDTTDSKFEQFFKVLQLHPNTHKAARALYKENDRVAIARSVSNNPEIGQVLDHKHEIMLMIRLGINQRFLGLIAELEAAAHQHQRDPKPPKNKMNQQEMIAYKTDLQRFPIYVGILADLGRNSVSAWARTSLTDEMVSDQSSLRKWRGLAIGEVLMAVAHEAKLEQRHSIRVRDYIELCELFISLIKSDLSKSEKLTKSKTSEDETLTKILLELLATRPLDPVAESKIVGEELAVYMSSGRLLYTLFTKFNEHIPEALVDTDHPAHQMTVELLSLVNQFHFADLDLPDYAIHQPFNFQLFLGMARRDFYDLLNYQEFIVNLERTARLEGPNAAWYQALKDYAIHISRFFKHEVVFEAKVAQDKVFAAPKGDVDSNFVEELPALLDLGSSPVIQISAESMEGTIDGYTFSSPMFRFHVSARRIAKERFVINADVMTLHEDEEGELNDMRKFRYQVRINNGEVSVYFPVIDEVNITPQLEQAAVEQVQRCIHAVYLQQSTGVVSGQKFESIPDLGTYTNKKLGDRDERMAQHEILRQQQVEKSLAMKAVTAPPDVSSSESAEEDAVRQVVPHTLLISQALQERMDKQGKKGAYAGIFADMASFVTRYNKEMDTKPGKAKQLTDVFGPKGETVWRFRPTYWTRCIAVTVGEGEAVIVDVNDRDEVYSGAKDMSKMVAREMAKYYQRK